MYVHKWGGSKWEKKRQNKSDSCSFTKYQSDKSGNYSYIKNDTQ